jgi:predicted DNA-binding transcriptional regulator AlpA
MAKKKSKKRPKEKPPWLLVAQLLPKPPADEPAPIAEPRLLTRQQVCELCGVSYPTLWAMMRRNEFPRARAIGSKANSRNVWLASEIEIWMRGLPLRRFKGDPPSPEGAVP